MDESPKTPPVSPPVQEAIYAKPKFACHVCDAKYSTKFNRDRHMKTCGEKKKEANFHPESPKFKPKKIKQEENENIDVKVDARSVKCFVSKDGAIDGKLIIPCSIYV